MFYGHSIFIYFFARAISFVLVTFFCLFLFLGQKVLSNLIDPIVCDVWCTDIDMVFVIDFR